VAEGTLARVGSTALSLARAKTRLFDQRFPATKRNFLAKSEFSLLEAAILTCEAANFNEELKGSEQECSGSA